MERKVKLDGKVRAVRRLTSDDAFPAPIAGSFNRRETASDRRFDEIVRGAESDLAAIKLLWPALRQLRRGWSVQPPVALECYLEDPDSETVYAVDTDRSAPGGVGRERVSASRPDPTPDQALNRQVDDADRAALVSALSAMSDVRRATSALIEALRRLRSAHRQLEHQAPALTTVLLGGRVDACPVCRHPAEKLKAGLCPRCYQSYYNWRNKAGNGGRDISEWHVWRQGNLKNLEAS